MATSFLDGDVQANRGLRFVVGRDALAPAINPAVLPAGAPATLVTISLLRIYPMRV